MKKTFVTFLDFLIFISLSVILYFLIRFLNTFMLEKIVLVAFGADVLVGLTIYLKTSVDFAIFVGNLANKNHGIKNLAIIILGTSLGNGIGTFFVLFVWIFLKQITLLLISMIVLASIILLKLSEENFDVFLENSKFGFFSKISSIVLTTIKYINKLFSPVTHFIIPKESSNFKKFSLFGLFTFSITIPFILGLDDFAGYVPLFNLVNIFGFCIGIFLGHFLLTSGLFISSKITDILRLPIVLFFGGMVFVVISFWGFIEASRIFFTFLQTLH